MATAVNRDKFFEKLMPYLEVNEKIIVFIFIKKGTLKPFLK
jgi:hypothetical protein